MFQQKNKTNVRYRVILIPVLAALLFTGCSDNVGGNETGKSTLSLSIHVPNASSGIAGKGAGDFTQTDGVNTLEIQSVGIVLREIELERQFELDCDEIEDQNGDNDFCEKFESGPILLQPNLDGSITHLVTIEVSEGVYDEVEFDVHKLSDDSAENRAFLTLHPEFDDLSIRVTGTYNGSDFVFTQDLMDEQEIALNPPITVGAIPEALNVTMNIDLSSWFRTADGTLVSPESANKGGENENLVEDNIKDSIDVFEDKDEDGKKDDD